MQNEKRLYSIEEFLEIAPISIAGAYKAIKEGKIPSVRIARRIFIPSWYINNLVSPPH